MSVAMTKTYGIRNALAQFPVTGELHKTGQSYRIDVLQQQHYDAVASLSEAVLAELHASGNGSFFLPKPEEVLRACLGTMDNPCGEQGFTLGVWVGQELVAKATLAIPRCQEEVCLIQSPPGLTWRDYTELRSGVVAPDYRGNNLHVELYRLRMQVAEQLREWVVVEYDVRNYHSWRTGFHAGMHIAYWAIDPSDGAMLIYAIKHRSACPLRAVGGEQVILNPSKDWTRLIAHLDAGYIGVSETSGQLTLLGK